jgi:hypothetical protein
MTNEFERRIGAAAARKSATGHASAAATQSNLLQAAIADWHVRIAPMVEQAVTSANQPLEAVGIRLTISKEVAHSIGIMRGGQTPMRPVISINSALTEQEAAAQVVNLGLSELLHPRPMPLIQIGLEANSSVFVAARHCRLPQRPPLPSSQLDKVRIRAIIADFVDAIIPSAK